MYDKLGVKHEPLSLIPPQFETPLPPLKPAVFPPTLREPPPPALELFDLDEHFASERIRLAQLCNKCDESTSEGGSGDRSSGSRQTGGRVSEKDLDYYVREAADIVGVTQQLPADERTARHALCYVAQALIRLRKLHHDSDEPLLLGGRVDASAAEGKGVGGIGSLYKSAVASAATSGTAGMGPAVAAGFSSPSKSRSAQ